MPNHVAVIFVHGINVRDQQYASAMRARLIRRLPKPLRQFLAFGSVFWADIVRSRQQNFIDQIRATCNVRDTQSRRFVVEGLGDAAAYQKTRARHNSSYYKIQARLSETLESLDDRAHPNRPIIFVGHSLGCHILSSYIWDLNTIKQLADGELAKWDDGTRAAHAVLKAASPFRRLDTIAGIVTMGSNMPLFTFTFGPQNVLPITNSRSPEKHAGFPGPILPGRIRDRARWLNFYSRNDLLGYPLKPFNDLYASEPRLTDIAVRSEGFLYSLVPSPLNAIAAHTRYWVNRDVIRGTAGLVREIVEAEETARA